MLSNYLSRDVCSARPVRTLVIFWTVAFLFISTGRSTPVYAQEPAASDTLQAPYLVSKIRFRGNRIFTRQQLDARVRTRANRLFLRIPRFTWWLWLYRLGDSGLFGSRVGRALKATGEPPALLDPIVLDQDVERLQLYYQQAGFRSALVRAEVDTLASQRLEVTFLIEQGTPTYVRNVVYDVTSLDRDQQRRLVDGSLLLNDADIPEDTLSFMPADVLFSEAMLHEERRRVLNFLLDEGFASVTRDSIRAIAFPQQPNAFDITFRIRPGSRFRFGDVRFAVDGPEQRAEARRDTVHSNPEASDGQISALIRGDRKLRSDLLSRTLQFVPGDWYDQSKLLATKRRLEGTGVFSFTRIDPLWADTAGIRGAGTHVLPHRINLETRERHQMRFEAFMLQRSGVLAADNELGTGVGVTYENLNLFGGAETFSLSTTGSIAADIDSTFFTSAQAEITSSMTFPYLFAPLKGLERTFNLYDARTQLSLSFLTARREELKFVIRGRGAARFRIEMLHTPTLVSYVDLFDLSLSNPDTLQGFKTAFLDQIEGSFDDLVQEAQFLEDYTKPQINSSLRYTLRSANVNPLRRDEGYSYEGAFEVGGNLPYLLDRLVHTPDTLEGRIPGLSLFRGGELENSLVYRQYVRLSGDFRQYTPINPSTVFAWKFIAGVAHPTGQARLVPFDRRFYSGGASSVRGWGLRELGPGRATPDSSSSIFGGDIKLEASMELRSTLLREVFAADWILTFFGDAGNVWFGPRNTGDADGRFHLTSFYREIGVGGGFGLRLAWEYLILRLDLAYRVHDPALSGVSTRSVRGGPRVHFGIGHAF